MTLEKVIRSRGRVNNLNLIRLCAASLVIVSHATSILGISGHDPITGFLQPVGLSAGQLALNLFFLVSGLLIAQSWQRAPDVSQYVCGRALRIFPGLLICNLFVVFVVGISFTRLGTAAYLSDGAVWRFLVKNTLLWQAGGSTNLPGVFADHPLTSANGSLWSLPFEIQSYSWLLLFGVLGLLKNGVVALLGLLAMGLAIHWKADVPIYSNFAFGGSGIVDLLLFFWIGVGLWRFSRFVPFPKWIILPAVAALALFYRFPEWRILFYASFPILVLYVAFVVKFSRLNEKADLSYGVYLYGFPIQQMLFQCFPALNQLTHTLLAIGLAMVLATFSWTFVESPALKLRERAVKWIKKGLEECMSLLRQGLPHGRA